MKTYRYFDTVKKGVVSVSKEIAEGERFIRLNAEQEAFFRANRRARYEEIWSGKLADEEPNYTEEELLEMAKARKIRRIEDYDCSERVNGFFFEGNLMWLDKSERAALKNTIESSVLVGREMRNVWYEEMCITLPVETARTMLAALEIYASDCYNVTARHILSVKNLSSIQEVESYDITADYPERLQFNAERK